MEHFHQRIEGWFDDQSASVYIDAVKEAPKDVPSHFVEVGAWLGKSAALMAVEIVNSGKSIKFDTVDHFHGSPSESYHQQVVRDLGGSTEQAFRKNMATGGVADRVGIIVLSSVEAARTFENRSLDFVFIDGSHVYSDVRDDIVAWLPKIRSGKTIAGHDVDRTAVLSAVQELLPCSEVQIIGSTWRFRVDKIERGYWLRNQLSSSDAMLYIPFVTNQELLLKAVRSIGSADVDIVIIDMSSSGVELDKLPAQVSVFRADTRLFFTQVQNLAQYLAKKNDKRLLLFMHTDCECKDELAAVDLVAWSRRHIYEQKKVGVIFTAYDALCVFDMNAVVDVGVWDETFQWYYSDLDYYRRLMLREWAHSQWPESHRVRHTPSATLRDDRMRLAQHREAINWNHEHYVHKWGGESGQEKYHLPYNKSE